jgi:hypothetical protein
VLEKDPIRRHGVSSHLAVTILCNLLQRIVSEGVFSTGKLPCSENSRKGLRQKLNGTMISQPPRMTTNLPKKVVFEEERNITSRLPLKLPHIVGSRRNPQ